LKTPKNKQDKVFPKVSVVILNWNGLDDTLVCVDSLKQSDYKGQLEVIVVDNGSSGNDAKELEKVKGIKLLKNPKNEGFAGGQIDGYEISSGEFVVPLNNDAVISPSYISLAVKIMQADNSIAMVGGRSYKFDDQNLPFNEANPYLGYQRIGPYNGEGIFTEDKSSGLVVDVNSLSGSCVVIRRSAVDEIGYFYRRFFAYFEETDLIARLKRSDWRVAYSSKLAIWHKEGVSSKKKSSNFTMYMLFRNRMMFLIRNFEVKVLGRTFSEIIKLYLKLFKNLIVNNKDWLDRSSTLTAMKGASVGLIWMLPKSVLSRFEVGRSIGATKNNDNYSQLIAKEQLEVSFCMQVESQNQLQQLKNWLKSGISPAGLDNFECLVVTSSTKIYVELQKIEALKTILNVDFKNVDSLNLCTVPSTGEFLFFLDVEKLNQLNIPKLVSHVYKLKKYKKDLLIESKEAVTTENWDKFKFNDVPYLTIRRSFFVESFGFSGGLSLSEVERSGAESLLAGRINEVRLMVLASLKKRSLLLIKESPTEEPTEGPKDALLHFNKDDLDDVHLSLLTSILEIRLGIIPAGTRFVTKVFKRLKLNKLWLLIKWGLSFKVPLRRKLGRVKNIAVSVIERDKTRLRLELKHIVNEATKGFDGVAKSELSLKTIKKLSKDYEEIPLFIICRDRVDDLRKLVKWAEDGGFKNICLIDNDSWYPPLKEYLATTSHQVIEMGFNAHHAVFWDRGIGQLLCPSRPYLLSDPDVIPSCPAKKVLPKLLSLARKSRYLHYNKIGLALKLDDLPDCFKLKQHVVDWESQFWRERLASDVYAAGVDTTFALYRPGAFDYIIHPSIRIAGVCEARHMPWYKNSNLKTDEDLFYEARASDAVNTWNKDALPERYKKEIERMKRRG
jgi:GT2 family glycosyltransferase